ncbi:hypothetical protein M407DRAFT_34230 [Tulasnella calospora MUT 4182]|uniref:Uncharacterized protein n=1 Tax=Tulasnella calospora MUT 4182 TaxID=1051891 RepID=A0A0C3PNW0_9AGAM|nr:hypothetical protein M407DRAFT_34230 [Tulasnella calospora MUT 4182]
MENVESAFTSGSPPPSHEDSWATSEFKARPTDRFMKLAGFRIDPSLLSFPKGEAEFSGGNATVSRAFLALLPNGRTTSQTITGTRDEHVGLEDHNLKSNSRLSNPEDDNECQEEEGKKGRPKPKSGEAVKEQEQDVNGEIVGRLPRKVCSRKLSGPV